jgi:carboxylesterase type B
MEDVIVVTVNYRLHTFGFMQLPKMGIAGNAGLKDQQMALKWVYDNISNFNGDPENITLFGESAGASSVHLHVLNAKSRRFFKKAICQSGCAMNDWMLQLDGVQRSKDLAKVLGCTSEDDQDIYETLMTASCKDLVTNGFRVNTKDERRRNINFVFKPTIESESEDAFMTKHPLELMKTEIIDIPVIFGTTDKEGMIQVAYMWKKRELFNEDPVRMIPVSLNVDPNSQLAIELAQQIKKFYFGSDQITEFTIDNFVDLMTDLFFLNPLAISSEMHRRYQLNSKQYLYEFCFDGDLNLMKKILSMDHCKGACHADDLFYLFGQRNFEVEIDEDSESSKMKKLMCKLWTNFAKYNDPTPAMEYGVKWMPVDNDNFNCLIIDTVPKMDANIHEERLEFWRNVYKNYNRDFIKSKI